MVIWKDKKFRLISFRLSLSLHAQTSFVPIFPFLQIWAAPNLTFDYELVSPVMRTFKMKLFRNQTWCVERSQMVKSEYGATHFLGIRDLKFTSHAFVFRRFFCARIILNHIPKAHHLFKLEVAHRFDLRMMEILDKRKFWISIQLYQWTSLHVIFPPERICCFASSEKDKSVQ